MCHHCLVALGQLAHAGQQLLVQGPTAVHEQHLQQGLHAVLPYWCCCRHCCCQLLCCCSDGLDGVHVPMVVGSAAEG